MRAPETITLDEMLLPLRVRSCLRNERCATAADIIARTSVELLRWPNFGRGSLRDLELELARFGLALADNEASRLPPPPSMIERRLSAIEERLEAIESLLRGRVAA